MRRVRPDVPPIAGGTLETIDDHRVIAGDELTDQLFVVDVGRAAITAALQLAEGAMPGRMAVDSTGAAHVALRGTGELLRVEPERLEIVARTRVCPAPRGVAFEPGASEVFVACGGGELLALSETHDRLGEWRLEPDLRDVVATATRLYVSRFRSAELLVLDHAGAVLRRSRPPAILGRGERIDEAPRVAYRLRPSVDGHLVMFHTMRFAGDLSRFRDRRTGLISYGGEALRGSGLVRSFFTTFDPAGEVLATEPVSELDGHTLVVDGTLHDGSIVPVFADPGSGHEAVAVASLGGDRMAMLHQDPERLLTLWTGGTRRVVVRRPMPLADLPPGREAFHRPSRSRLACASCHPEGHEDGHVWVQPGGAPRRTQSLLGGLIGTEPFHWAGDAHDFAALMELQEQRMGADFVAEEREQMLAWLDLLPEPPGRPAIAPDVDATLGGLFVEAGCARCHAGPRLSDGESHDVGAGPMQTPRLGGVLHRAPYFHDGCAASLKETLDGSCRPLDDHGVADGALRARLVQYLATL